MAIAVVYLVDYEVFSGVNAPWIAWIVDHKRVWIDTCYNRKKGDTELGLVYESTFRDIRPIVPPLRGSTSSCHLPRADARGYPLDAPTPPQHANSGRAGDPGTGAVPCSYDCSNALKGSSFYPQLLTTVPRFSHPPPTFSKRLKLCSFGTIQQTVVENGGEQREW